MPCELYRVPVQEEDTLAIRTTYTQARANLARLCDEATDNREVVIISRRSGEDVALVAASELAGLTETAHLLRSPKNAERLLKALAQAKSGAGSPETVDELRRDLGLDSED
jgi:antitoxin YefM